MSACTGVVDSEKLFPLHYLPVYIGSAWRDVSYAGSDGKKHPFTIRTVYEIIERNIDKRGQYLFPADVEVNMWDVNGLLTAYLRRTACI